MEKDLNFAIFAGKVFDFMSLVFKLELDLSLTENFNKKNLDNELFTLSLLCASEVKLV